jgi:hypothetical protein
MPGPTDWVSRVGESAAPIVARDDDFAVAWRPLWLSKRGSLIFVPRKLPIRQNALSLRQTKPRLHYRGLTWSSLVNLGVAPHDASILSQVRITQMVSKKCRALSKKCKSNRASALNVTCQTGDQRGPDAGRAAHPSARKQP